MSRTCVNHRESAASVMCHRCHKPICTECTIVTATGSFCSAECNLQHAMFKQTLARASTGPRLGVIGWVFAMLLLLIAFMVVIHFAAKMFPPLEGIDVLGGLIGGVRKILTGN